MPIPPDRLVVKSHVARDLLQTAGLFKTDRQVVWEYVVNGLQYCDPGTNPMVKVTLDARKRRLTVADNGRGMDWEALKNFFVMHGENLDRKQGKAGRGRFGTGKAAAFGIADLLRITTIRNQRKSRVELSRSAIERMGTGEEIPVRVLDQEVAVSQPNSTLVEIEGIHLRSLDQAGIIRYIERQLARWPKNVYVFVNNHECEIAEPPVAWERKFVPEEQVKEALGDVELVVRVSRTPLEEDLRGISIYSRGVWHETTLAGSEGREMAQFIFGEIDVPRLDEDDAPIAPFDVSRSMQLNPSNELVRMTYAFINRGVEEVRRQLLDAEKSRRATEEARKLAEQATEIAKLINEDFSDFRSKVAKVKAKEVGASDIFLSRKPDADDDANLLPGSEVPVEETSPTGNAGSQGGPGGNGTEPRLLMPQLARVSDGERRGRSAAGSSKGKGQGGFRVSFRNAGAQSDRALYVADERTIYINLDHPQVAAAKGLGPVDQPTFRRLAYEIAFSEYAIALATELERQGEYFDLTDPIVDIRGTLNRLARRGAALYSA